MIIETILHTDLKEMVRVTALKGNLFSADNGGNKITVKLTDNGVPAAVSGVVTGYMIRDDHKTVLITGETVTDADEVSITLPASAYTVIGPVSIVIKVGTTTIGACTTYVYRTTTDSIVDPGSTIPSMSELLAKIQACETATAAANAAATAADEKATLANTAATNATSATATALAAGTKIDNMDVSAVGLAAGTSPTVAVTETGADNHKVIAFGIPKGDPGKDFRIKRTFVSIAAMQAYDPTQDQTAYKVLEFDYVMIDTGSVQDADTGKLYCYEPQTQDVWRYIGDLSGSQGIQGPTGNGIASIVLNDDYTLTITYTDGTTGRTGSIRGATGATGETGNGIASVVLNDDYTLTITYTDGTDVTTDSIRGETGATGPTGATGATGNGIASITFNNDYTLTIAFTDGTSMTTGSIRGEKGDTGSISGAYANTLEMSSSDSTKISEAMDNKVDKVQSAQSGALAIFDSNGGLVSGTLTQANVVSRNYMSNQLNSTDTSRIGRSLSSIISEYDSTKVYDEGDLCVYWDLSQIYSSTDYRPKLIYKRKSWGSDTPVAETFDSTHWDVTTLEDYLSAISEKQDKVIAGNWGNFVGYRMDGNLYVTNYGPSSFLTDYSPVLTKETLNFPSNDTEFNLTGVFPLPAYSPAIGYSRSFVAAYEFSDLSVFASNVTVMFDNQTDTVSLGCTLKAHCPASTATLIFCKQTAASTNQILRTWYDKLDASKIVYSSTEPSNPTTGMIWLKPIGE